MSDLRGQLERQEIVVLQGLQERRENRENQALLVLMA